MKKNLGVFFIMTVTGTVKHNKSYPIVLFWNFRSFLALIGKKEKEIFSFIAEWFWETFCSLPRLYLGFEFDALLHIFNKYKN